MAVKVTIRLTEFCLERLKALIKHAKESWGKRIVQHIEDLDEELSRAEIVEPPVNELSGADYPLLLAPVIGLGPLADRCKLS